MSSSFDPQNYNNKNYYEILGVDKATADTNAIRKAYLKLSLKYHPDKNPPHLKKEAEAKFVDIGEAYEILSNPQKRRQYDRYYHTTTKNNYSKNQTSSFDTDNNNTSRRRNAAEYYKQSFDATVASMSEEELAAAVGTAAVVGSLVGSIVGSRLLAGKKSKGTSSSSSLLGQVGSLAGSIVASEMAASSVRALHQQSVERIAYREECQRAMERGEPLPPKQKPEKNINQAAQKLWSSVKNIDAQEARQTVDNLWNQVRTKMNHGNNNSRQNNKYAPS